VKEYHADLELTKDISEWLLIQEATVAKSGAHQVWNRKTGGWEDDKPVVMFGHRRIHFYSGDCNNLGRIFFNEDTIGSALVLMIKWPNAIIYHNFPKEMA
jgi:hypothetical protein